MTVVSTSFARRITRPVRRSALAVALGAGVVLTPLSTLGATPANAAVVAPDHAAQVVVDTAMSELGHPYVWGGTGPGFDCSGLTLFSFRAAGVTLPHSAHAQSTMGTPVSAANLQPGDLLFFYGGGHVAIYLGNGDVIHAPTFGESVQITKASYMGAFTARRLV